MKLRVPQVTGYARTPSTVLFCRVRNTRKCPAFARDLANAPPPLELFSTCFVLRNARALLLLPAALAFVSFGFVLVRVRVRAWLSAWSLHVAVSILRGAILFTATPRTRKEFPSAFARAPSSLTPCGVRNTHKYLAFREGLGHCPSPSRVIQHLLCFAQRTRIPLIF